MYSMVIVDDEYYTCEGMKKIIDWSEYNVQIAGTASDGTEGLELVRRLKPDIVVTDIKMKTMDGLDMISALRKESFRGEIIILSGYRIFEYAQRAIEENVSSYLVKPVNTEKLRKSIEFVIQKLDKDKPKSTMSVKAGKSSELIKNVIEYIDAHYAEDIQCERIAAMFFIERTYLSKVFKEYTGITYMEYITTTRINKAKELMLSSSMPISDIIVSVGYKDQGFFRDVFKKHVGMSPQEFRSKGEQTEI